MFIGCLLEGVIRQREKFWPFLEFTFSVAKQLLKCWYNNFGAFMSFPRLMIRVCVLTDF